MAYDLLLRKNTRRNWSRDPLAFAGVVTSGAAPAISAPLTDEEKGRIEKLAKLQMLAVRGDADALKQIIVINKALTVLQAKSSKGDAKAKRIIDTLLPTGLVEKISSSAKGVPTKLVLSGDDESGMDEILGSEEIITSGDMGYNGHLAYLQGLGEEEVALALEGGACERNAIRRRR